MVERPGDAAGWAGDVVEPVDACFRVVVPDRLISSGGWLSARHYNEHRPHQSREQRPPLHTPGQPVDVTDRIKHTRVVQGMPKEIARALKMPPSAVAPLIRSVAAAEGRTREDALIGCWISPGWSSSVLAPERPDWPGSGPSERTGHSGLVTVLAARDRGGSTAGVCFYLVDTWCLGLKDAAGPRSMDRRQLGGFIQQIFSAWDEPPCRCRWSWAGRSSTARSGTRGS